MTQVVDIQVPAPAGLRLRPYAGEADVVDIARLENAELAADGIPERTTIEETRIALSNPNDKFDAARDVTIAMVGDEVVGYGKRDWVDLRDTDAREYRVHGVVHPEWRRQGIGMALLRHNEERAQELAAMHDSGITKVLGSWSGDTQAGDIGLLTATGYEQVRFFFEMVRPSLDEVPDVPLPPGLAFRPVTPENLRRIWDANVEAFQDHWGGVDGSDESFQRNISYPSHDPSLWVIAFDGHEPAGGVKNAIFPEENEALGIKRGWLASVWTRRPWRRRGLAKAAIARSLALLRERGMTTAGLGVDADNPTGALGLYESVGFQVDFRSTAWRKPFENPTSSERNS